MKETNNSEKMIDLFIETIMPKAPIYQKLFIRRYLINRNNGGNTNDRK